MKFPNGYGSISKLSGNRRRPYIVRKQGHAIGYFATREEALEFLVEHNKTPQEKSQNMTFREVYEYMIDSRSNELSSSTLSGYQNYFNKSKSVHDTSYKDLTLLDFRMLIEDEKVTLSSRRHYRSFLSAMDKTAAALDIITKRNTEFLPSYTAKQQNERIPFTEEEIQTIWENKDQPYYDLVLMLLYTGLRRAELAEMKKDNVHLAEGYMVGGKKTKAGTDRIIPIHPKIAPMIEYWYHESQSGMLLDFGVDTLYKRFKEIMDRHGMVHTPHDCRHTFITRLYEAGADRKSIDLIVGHESGNVGLDVYTHKSIDQLKEAILLLY